jgi:hypothetical protein
MRIDKPRYRGSGEKSAGMYETNMTDTIDKGTHETDSMPIKQ